MQYYNITQPYKRMKKMPFVATWMNLEGIMLSEMSDREWQILYDITYIWNLKILHTSEYNKKEANSQMQRIN